MGDKTKTKIAIARVVSAIVRRSRRLTGRGDEVTVVRGGNRWRLDLRQGIDFAIYVRGSFEPDMVRCYARHVAPGDTVLDIAANIGANTLPLARRVGPNGRVIAFEPTDFGVEKLQRNISLNPDLASRISIERIALTNQEGWIVPGRFYASWPLDNSEDTHERHFGTLKDSSVTHGRSLDGYMRDAGIGRVDFIKLDVDGFELDVLEGARETLGRERPDIVMELAPYAHENRKGSFEKMLKILFDLGYHLSGVKDGQLLPDDPALVTRMIADGTGINVLAQTK